MGKRKGWDKEEGGGDGIALAKALNCTFRYGYCELVLHQHTSQYNGVPNGVHGHKHWHQKLSPYPGIIILEGEVT